MALLLAVIFAGIALTLFKMFYGTTDRTDMKPGETNIPGTVSIAVLLIVILVTGVIIPEGLKELITQAQIIITGK